MQRETGDDGVERVRVGEGLQRRGAEELARGASGSIATTSCPASARARAR
jgi:hypothetical protein